MHCNLLYYSFASRNLDRLIACSPQGDVYKRPSGRNANRRSMVYKEIYSDMLIENSRRQIQMRTRPAIVGSGIEPTRFTSRLHAEKDC